MEPISTIKKIYSHLEDALSKEYFKSRLLYSLTGDYSEICRMVSLTYPGIAIRDKINSLSDAVPYIWGTGYCGTMLKKSFSDIQWKGFIDNYPSEKEKMGLPVLRPEEFLEQRDRAVVVVATTDWHTEILQQLEGYSIPRDHIIDMGEMILGLFECQYFDLPCLQHSNEEVFVDVGCFDGFTVRNFIKWSRGNYKEIIAFEPDAKCFHMCKEKLADVPCLDLRNNGLWRENCTLSFSAPGDSTSKIMENGTEKIEAVRLDDVIGNREVSFIKMDIEGSEKEALSGAVDTIRKHAPKLAISIYHKPQDIWEIPELILNLNPAYHFYIRHYAMYEAETVLYAV